MTRLLEQALQEIERLSEDEQDSVAQWLLEELASERRWGEAFAATGDRLGDLADEALQDHRAGRSEPLDPERL